MDELNTEEARELLIGTWIGVAMIAEMLVERGLVTRQELLEPLVDAERLAKDRRRTALSALRKLIEDGFGNGKTDAGFSAGYAAIPIGIRSPQPTGLACRASPRVPRSGIAHR